jgi:hypothetical protein
MASRPLSGSAARRVWRPLLRAACRSAASCSHSSRRRFVVDEIKRRAAWHGPANRRTARLPRSALRCRAAACHDSVTDDAHHRRGVFIIKHFRLKCSAVWHSTLKPQRCSLSSSPLASLSSRHNSNCRSTLRSWISTTLLVRTDADKEHLCCQRKKPFLLFRLSSCSVPALRGDCTVLWQCSDVFWEQRDYFVRKEGLCVCGLMFFCRRLDNNELSGTIPSTVGQLSSLQFL